MANKKCNVTNMDSTLWACSFRLQTLLFQYCTFFLPIPNSTCAILKLGFKKQELRNVTFEGSNFNLKDLAHCNKSYPLVQNTHKMLATYDLNECKNLKINLHLTTIIPLKKLEPH